MSRKSGVWFWRKRNQYMTTIRRKQYNLGVKGPKSPERKALALDRLAALVDRLEQSCTGNPGPQGALPENPALLTISRACDEFLAEAKRKHQQGSLTAGALRHYTRPLASLSAELGSRPVREVKPAELESWACKPTWGDTTRHTYLGVVLMVLRPHAPGLKVLRPSPRSRGADCVLTDEQFALLLAEVRRCRCKNDLAELLLTLRSTGARPQEIAPLAVADVDWVNKLVRLGKHKTGRKTGAPRLIRLNSDALAVLEQQRARYGTGLLFRNACGRAYSNTAIAYRLRPASARLGTRVIAYGLRHGFATEALVKGVPSALVAELLGHKGTKMLETHYSHLGDRARELQDAVERLAKGKT